MDVHLQFHDPLTKQDSVKWKAEDDPVTIADQRSQYIVYHGLKHVFPLLHIIGEEKEDTMQETEFDFDI